VRPRPRTAPRTLHANVGRVHASTSRRIRSLYSPLYSRPAAHRSGARRAARHPEHHRFRLAPRWQLPIQPPAGRANRSALGALKPITTCGLRSVGPRRLTRQATSFSPGRNAAPGPRVTTEPPSRSAPVRHGIDLRTLRRQQTRSTPEAPPDTLPRRPVRLQPGRPQAERSVRRGDEGRPRDRLAHHRKRRPPTPASWLLRDHWGGLPARSRQCWVWRESSFPIGRVEHASSQMSFPLRNHTPHSSERTKVAICCAQHMATKRSRRSARGARSDPPERRRPDRGLRSGGDGQGSPVSGDVDTLLVRRQGGFRGAASALASRRRNAVVGSRTGPRLKALRLGRILAELLPSEPEVHGLVALMEPNAPPHRYAPAVA